MSRLERSLEWIGSAVVLAAVLGGMLGGAVGCASSGQYIAYHDGRSVEPSGSVVTFVDFFNAGRAAVQEHLDALPPEERIALEASLERASAACVRLSLISERSGLDYATIGGSGVVVRVDEGAPIRVLTAGHALADLKEYDATVTLCNGQTLSTSPLESTFEQFASSSHDWAVLSIDGEEAAGHALDVEPPRVGETVFFLGYPNGMGISDADRIVYGFAYSGEPLAPIVAVGKITDAAPLTIAPVAGSLTMEGASGGAIVNARGNVVGVLTGTSWVPDREGATYWITGASVTVFENLLRGNP